MLRELIEWKIGHKLTNKQFKAVLKIASDTFKVVKRLKKHSQTAICKC
jgi:hypothetical protein